MVKFPSERMRDTPMEFGEQITLGDFSPWTRCMSAFWQEFWRDDPEGLASYQDRMRGIERRLADVLARKAAA